MDQLTPELAAEVDRAVANMVLDQIRKVVQVVEDVAGIGLPAPVVRAVEGGALTQWTWLAKQYIQLGGEPYKIEPLVTGGWGKEPRTTWEYGPDGNIATTED